MMRTDLGMELYCSKCGNKLAINLQSADSGNKIQSITGNSAYNCTIKLVIDPCSKCYEKGQRPLELIRELLNESKKY